MVSALLLLLTPWFGQAVAAPALEEALVAELARAKTLRLPDAEPPYFVAYDVLDGEIVTAFGELGALVSLGTEDHRSLRAEVRVGDYALDSSNFVAFGEPDGIAQLRLPIGDDVLALRREVWSATDSAYKAAVEQLSRKQAAREGDTSPRPPDFEARPPVVSGTSTPRPPIDSARLTALVESLSGALAAEPSIELGQAIVRQWQGERLIVTSEGTRVWMPTGYTVLRVEGTIRLPDGSRERDARSWVVRTPADLPPQAELLAEVGEMAAWLRGLRDAPVEEDYLGPVIFEGQAAIELFSQLLAAEVSGTPAAEEEPREGELPSSGPVQARLGRRLLPRGWSVVDDVPGAAGSPAFYPYDHEGVAPRAVTLVSDGVLVDVLMSRIPRKDRAHSTGHGRSVRSGRRGAVPGAVTVTPDRTTRAKKLSRMALEIGRVAGHEYVLVVKQIEPPAINEQLDITFSGEGPPPGLTVPFEVERLYADGRREPVRSLRFLGVDRGVLREIEAAGPMVGPVTLLDGPPGVGRFAIGPTGGMPVVWSAPSVLVAEVELVSRAGGEPRVLTPPRVANGPTR